MPGYKLIVKNAKVFLKTVTNAVLNISGIKDLLTGDGSVDSNNKINWTLQEYTNTSANFTSINPVLLLGQKGIETDDLLTTPKFKIGDGVTAWNTLPYFSIGGSSGVQSVTGTNVDNTDPLNPIVNNLGLIQIVDLAGDFFNDLTTASAYVQTFTSATLTNESFTNGVYYFTVPSNSDFSNTNFFLSLGIFTPTSAYIIDSFGLITVFSDSLCLNNRGNNIFGNITCNGDSFNLSSGINTFNDVSSDTPSFVSSTGKFIFYGSVTATGIFLTDFFLTSTATILTLASNFGNSNLLQASTNGANVFYDGIDKENSVNKVINFSSPNHTTFPTTQATIDLVDNRVQSNIKIIGDWDATSGSMPLDDESNTTPFIAMWGSAIKQGWAFRVGYGQAGTVGGYDYEEGDVVYALLDNAGATPADWGDLDHNLQQATETLRGTGKVITAAIIADETTTDDQRFVTGIKLWQNFWTRVLAIAHTFAAKITFSTAPRFSSVTASQYLKVDGNKDLTSVSAIPATDVTEDTTHRFITDAERLKWNNFSYCDGTDGTVSVTNVLTISQSVLIPANTFTPGQNQSLEIQGKARKTNNNSFAFQYLMINTSLSTSGATTLGGVTTSSNNTFDYLGSTRIIPIQSTSFYCNNAVSNTSGDDNGIVAAGANITIDWTVDQYIMNVVRANSATDSIEGTFLRVIQH